MLSFGILYFAQPAGDYAIFSVIITEQDAKVSGSKQFIFNAVKYSSLKFPAEIWYKLFNFYSDSKYS